MPYAQRSTTGLFIVTRHAGSPLAMVPGTPWTSAAEFDMIMAHFLPPAEDERFNVIRHHRDA